MFNPCNPRLNGLVGQEANPINHGSANFTKEHNGTIKVESPPAGEAGKVDERNPANFGKDEGLPAEVSAGRK